MLAKDGEHGASGKSAHFVGKKRYKEIHEGGANDNAPRPYL